MDRAVRLGNDKQERLRLDLLWLAGCVERDDGKLAMKGHNELSSISQPGRR